MIALSQLAKLLGAELYQPFSCRSTDGAGRDELQGSDELQGRDDLKIGAVAGIASAAPDTLVFAEDSGSFAAAAASGAAAILVSRPAAGALAACSKPLLYSVQPRLAFARAAKLLAASREVSDCPAAVIHPSAVVAESAELAVGVVVGALAVIGKQARVGAASVIESGAILGDGASIGANCRIFPRAVLYPGTSLGDRVIVHAGAVLGGDGFGYVRDPETGEYIKFPQQGRLVIEDDVEIGANTTIDRGALEETRIARGAKIDNLVHIGHNVSIGRNAVIAAQTGISGSSVIGNDAVLGGQVGIGDHAGVGDGVILGGQAGILPHKRLAGPGILFWGTPAQPVRRYLRQLAMLARLARSAQPTAKDK